MMFVAVRRFVSPAALLAVLTVAAAGEKRAIQRYLVSLKLGDKLEDVRAVYPPRREWTIGRDRKGMTRLDLERGDARGLPGDMEVLRLTFDSGRLARIQLIYHREAARKKPVHSLVADFSLVYDEPRRTGLVYWWRDSDTVLRISEAELPTPEGSELRPSLELMEKWLFQP